MPKRTSEVLAVSVPPETARELREIAGDFESLYEELDLINVDDALLRSAGDLRRRMPFVAMTLFTSRRLFNFMTRTSYS